MSSRLPAAGFWILTALVEHRRHGYEILRETASASDGHVELKVATLYAALDRLERDGLVAADGEEIVSGRARRYYRITSDGLSRLGQEVEQMERSARTARQRLTAGPLRPAVEPT